MKATNLSLLIVLLSTMISINAQQKKLEYSIKRNGDVVGNIHFIQGIVGNRIVLTMESEVNTRFIFNFKAKAKEEVIYDNGIMTWSSIFRKLNGNVKVDKKTKATGNAYTVYKGSKTETLNNYPIRYNMLSVYINEPVNITKVYSDNFQQQIDIQKIADHHYKIKFPDGNYNEYFYINGVCSKIEIHHSMYSATIELRS
ncbi:MAG TPA: DUF6134 family protein [Chitinophagaceae bacterium]|jgi:hypothetical protein|nr:DUF6134 family protein [Chitinophagaceae bacterium]